MKKIILFFILFILTVLQTINCFAQSQFQLAIKMGNGYNTAYSIIKTIDGGYVATGSFDYLTDSLFIVKLSSNGLIQWAKTTGGTSPFFGYSAVQTTDGGYAIATATNSFGAGSYDWYILKLTSNGSLQWAKTVGGTMYDEAYSIIQTTDGGFAVAGSNESFGMSVGSIFIIKLDAYGSLQWAKSVGGPSDVAFSIIQTTDGGFAIAGYTSTYGVGQGNMYIIKLDANGSLQWSKTIGGTYIDCAYSVVNTFDGGYVLAGYTVSFGAGSNDMYIVKLDANGSLQWSRTVGGAGFERARSVIQTTDDGYAVAGYTDSFGAGFDDMYIIKLSSNGSLQWSRTVGGTMYDEAYSIIQTTDGGYAVAGQTTSFGGALSRFYIVKLDSNGNTCSNSTSPSSIIGTPNSIITSPASNITTQNPNITTPVPTFSTGGIVTPICIVGIRPIFHQVPNSFSLSQNYPNPFNPSTKIKFDIAPSPQGEGRGEVVKLIIYDILGHEVASLIPPLWGGQEGLQPGSYEYEFNGNNFASGVYYYKLESGEYSETKKMVLIK